MTTFARRITIPVMLMFAVLFGASVSGIAVAALGEAHMNHAQNFLNSALVELNAARHDKAGHREAAIRLGPNRMVRGAAAKFRPASPPATSPATTSSFPRPNPRRGAGSFFALAEISG